MRSRSGSPPESRPMSGALFAGLYLVGLLPIYLLMTPGLSLIPLVLTVLHLCGIVPGVRGAGTVAPAPAGVGA